MRTIKFRGKDVNGKWHYGLLSISQGRAGQPEKGYYISNSCGSPWACLVIHETVGQFTGIHDVTGNWIYEGDILGYPITTGYEIVKWSERLCCFHLYDVRGIQASYQLTDRKSEIASVLGNVWDNKELLKGD